MGPWHRGTVRAVLGWSLAAGLAMVGVLLATETVLWALRLAVLVLPPLTGLAVAWYARGHAPRWPEGAEADRAVRR